MQEYCSPMDGNTKLLSDQEELLENAGRYMKLVGKLNYLTVSRSDTVSVMSQFLPVPRTTHWQAVMRILRYLKKARGKGLLYSVHGHTRVTYFSYADWE